MSRLTHTVGVQFPHGQVRIEITGDVAHLDLTQTQLEPATRAALHRIITILEANQ